MAKKKQLNLQFLSLNIARYEEEINSWFKKGGKKFKKIKKNEACGLQSFFWIPLGLLIIVAAILISSELPKNRSQTAKERLVKNPRDFEARLILAEEYLKNNRIEEAEKELRLAQSLQPHEIQLHLLWQKKMSLNPEDIGQLIEFWEKIVSERPFYRDGFLQLASLSFKIGQKDAAQNYLQRALEIDPNFEAGLKLKEALF